jgi:hypothetical protein
MGNEVIGVTHGQKESMMLAEIEREERIFELAQRKASVYAKSDLVPKAYQNNIGNVLIATNMAQRLNADLLQVMQNLYVVHGTPGWSSQFLIATFNSCGRFTAIRYKFSGEPGQMDYGCYAYTKERESGDLVEGTRITLEMAQKEGWSTKSGSKWRTMPDQMLRYRSAAFLIRSTAPEIGMGLMTMEELHDMGKPSKSQQEPASVSALTENILGPSSPSNEEMEGEGDEDVIDVVLDDQGDGSGMTDEEKEAAYRRELEETN